MENRQSSGESTAFQASRSQHRLAQVGRHLAAAKRTSMPMASGLTANGTVATASNQLPVASGTSESSGTENLLDFERENPSFDVRQMTYLLDGGPLFTQFRELMAQVIENDDQLRDVNRYDLTKDELRERTMLKIKRVAELWNQTAGDQGTKGERVVPRSGKKTSNEAKAMQEKAVGDALFHWMNLYDPSWATRIGVHFGLFMSAIQGQGTDEQKEKWLPLAQNVDIYGCFAMTELGHGSYIRGFETTATYDKKTQEFVINSPTETSTKWWIGGAGQTATHCVAYARLIIDEKDYGIHTFIVPLREIETGRPFPGIFIGDVGMKMGRNGIDNGFIQFHNVRVPREHMLMRWSKVSPEGIYTPAPSAQMSYGALMIGRVSFVQEASDYVKKALTIAIRYSAVRRQFPDPTEQKEEQLLNYQTHQYRLLPILATCFAMHFASTQTRKLFEDLQEALSNEDLSSLAGVHATTAGLKAFSTWWCHESIERCRQCLGGLGYSSYAALASLSEDWAVMCTWEGDNTVLAQQTARYLMKCEKKSQRGEPLAGFESYLQNMPSTLGMASFPGTPEDLLDSEKQLLIFKRLCVRLIATCAQRFRGRQAETGNKAIAWNECMVELVECSRAHCDFFIVNCFVEQLRWVKAKRPDLFSVLKALSDLHALWTLERYLPILLEDGFFQQQHSQALRTFIRQLCGKIRKDAIPLVDSFNIPDFILNSPLGRHDGQVYKHFFETVKNAPGAMKPTPYWNSLIRPLLTKKP